MAVPLFEEFLLLFQMACVVFLFVYLFLEEPVLYADPGASRYSRNTGFLSLIFGLFSIYGMSTGISFYTANVDIRETSPHWQRVLHVDPISGSGRILSGTSTGFPWEGLTCMP